MVRTVRINRFVIRRRKIKTHTVDVKKLKNLDRLKRKWGGQHEKEKRT